MITSQKKIISDYLKNATSHPSAEEIYLEVRKKLPRISKGTVYRNLKVLKEEKKFKKLLPANHIMTVTFPHMLIIFAKNAVEFLIFLKIVGIAEF